MVLIAHALQGMDAREQAKIHQTLIALDGTLLKWPLGCQCHYRHLAGRVASSSSQ
jgi:enolase